jgi:sugar phosphate isomerase/epimerase
MFKNLNPRALGLSASQSELIELSLSFGFRAVDLDIVEFADEIKRHGLPKARRLLDSAKLLVGTISLPIDWQADEKAFAEQLPRLAELAALAAGMGCRRALTVIAPASDERPYHQNFEFCRQRLVEVGRVLAEHGMRLAVGFDSGEAARKNRGFEFIHDLDALQILLGTVGSENVGLWLDVWHVWAAGGSLAAARKKLTSDRLVAVSLADAASPEDTSGLPANDPRDPAARRLPGESGIIDSVAALAMLGEMGYDGPVTVLCDASRFAGMRRDQIVKLTAEKLDAVWKAAGLNKAGKLAAPAG